MSQYEDLKKAILEKNEAETKRLINEIIDSEEGKMSRAEALVNLANIYITLKNDIDEEYLAHLNEAIKKIKEIDSGLEKIDTRKEEIKINDTLNQ